MTIKTIRLTRHEAPTFATCRVAFANANRWPTRRATRQGANVWPTAGLPNWQAFSPKTNEMTMRNETFTSLTITAIQRGSEVRLVDSCGTFITQWLPPGHLTAIWSSKALDHQRWLHCVQRILEQTERHERRCAMSPWQLRTASMSASFRLRGQFPNRRKQRVARGWLEPFSTTTWEAAIPRLYEQMHNSRRKHLRSSWERWFITVSNNHNKRKGGRYAQG